VAAVATIAINSSAIDFNPSLVAVTLVANCEGMLAGVTFIVDWFRSKRMR